VERRDFGIAPLTSRTRRDILSFKLTLFNLIALIPLAPIANTTR
jgi:hypothetical protein